MAVGTACREIVGASTRNDQGGAPCRGGGAMTSNTELGGVARNRRSYNPGVSRASSPDPLCCMVGPDLVEG
jgi:hypothetical protein